MRHVRFQRRFCDLLRDHTTRLHWPVRSLEPARHASVDLRSQQISAREELVIDKDVNQRMETVSDTVRYTEVDVEDDRTAGRSSGGMLSTDRTGTGF